MSAPQKTYIFGFAEGGNPDKYLENLIKEHNATVVHKYSMKSPAFAVQLPEDVGAGIMANAKGDSESEFVEFVEEDSDVHI